MMKQACFYVILVLTLRTIPAAAFGLAIGGASVDQGDNRLIPSALLMIEGKTSFSSNIYYYGTKSATYEDRFILISLERRWSLSAIESLQVSTGILIMNHAILYSVPESSPTGAVDKAPYVDGGIDSQSPSPKNRSYYNAAAILGLHYRLLHGHRIWMELSWDSQIFPAGVQALTLTFDLHDAMSLVLGVSI